MTMDNLIVKKNIVNRIENIKVQPFQLPLNDILINTKNTWLDIINKTSDGKNIFDNFNYENTFYIAITFIIIALLYVLIYFIFT